MKDELPALVNQRSLTLKLAAAFITLVLLAATFAPWLSPYPAGGLEEKRLLETPSLAHWMGTDGLGRDLFTRVLYGARVSIAVGLGTAVIALLLGTAYGLF
ncbi:MAG: ABC transporter permease, partial [Deltaproteobacteria bacterium]|nr:ABC transporter permease [Deltaproteobacteria bacterium]